MENAEHVPDLSVSGTVATIRLRRPLKMNKLTPADLVTLMEHFATVEADPTVRVLILTAEGRAFSAGYDLGDIAKRTAGDDDGPQNTGRALAFEDVVDRLENLELPTICRLNGGVYGGATDIALSCDFRIGVDSCEMFMPAARLGLHYYKSGIVRFVSRLGVTAAKKLFLTARKLDAHEMVRIGYLDAAVPADRLDAHVDELAAVLAGNAPVAMRGMKKAINEFARQHFDEAAADLRYRASLAGPEIREGTVAFAQKRAPRF